MHAQYLLIAASFAFSGLAAPVPASGPGNIARSDSGSVRRNQLDSRGVVPSNDSDYESDVAEAQHNSVEVEERDAESYKMREILEMIQRDIVDIKKRQFSGNGNLEYRDAEEKRQFSGNGNLEYRDTEDKRQFSGNGNLEYRDVKEKRQFSGNGNLEYRDAEEKRQFSGNGNLEYRDAEEKRQFAGSSSVTGGSGN